MNVYVLKRARAFQSKPYGFHVCMILSLIHHGVTQSLTEF